MINPIDSNPVNGLDMKMPIYEIFTSVEGEGLKVGTPTLFIRVAGCNFCCPFCDTKQSWQGDNGSEMTIGLIVERVKSILVESPAIQRVSITGGNPMLYKNQLLFLFITLFDEVGDKVEFNLEHPGVRMGWTLQQFKEERYFLFMLYIEVKKNRKYPIHFTLNMDVKFPLWDYDETAQMVSIHNNLILMIKSLELSHETMNIDSCFHFSVKALIQDKKDLNAWVKYKERLSDGGEDLNSSWWLALVRGSDNKVNTSFAKEVLRTLLSTKSQWRLNPNLHVQLNLQ